MKAQIILALILTSFTANARISGQTQLKTAEYTDWVEQRMSEANLIKRKGQVIYDWYGNKNELYQLADEAIKRNPKFPYQKDNFSVLLSANKQHAVFVGGASSLPYSGPNIGLRVYDLNLKKFRPQVRHALKFVGVLEDSNDKYSLLLAAKDAHLGLELAEVPMHDATDDSEVSEYYSFYFTKKTHQLYEYNVTTGTIEKIVSPFEENVTVEENEEYFTVPMCVSDGSYKCFGPNAKKVARQIKKYY